MTLDYTLLRVAQRATRRVVVHKAVVAPPLARSSSQPVHDMSFEALYASMIATGGNNFAGRCINDFVSSTLMRSDTGGSLDPEGPPAASHAGDG